jgi:acyl-CoA thioesterase-1
MTIRALTCLLFLFPWSMIAEIAPPLPTVKPRTAVVFGDSITEGGTLPKDQRDQTWVRVVERESKGLLTMVNEGKGGRPTKSVPECEAMLARRPRADILIIALGTNDSRDITAECVPKAVANLDTMIGLARKTYGPGIAILLVGPPNIHQSTLGPTKPIGDQREAKLRALGEAFALLAKEHHCEFVSLFGVVPDTSFTKDGVHPDAAGHAAIARVILKKLLP